LELERLADWGQNTMSALQQATRAGFHNVEHMKKDKDLDPLRSRDDFKKLLADLEEQTRKKGR
jgi:hypothetical protein